MKQQKSFYVLPNDISLFLLLLLFYYKSNSFNIYPCKLSQVMYVRKTIHPSSQNWYTSRRRNFCKCRIFSLVGFYARGQWILFAIQTHIKGHLYLINERFYHTSIRDPICPFISFNRSKITFYWTPSILHTTIQK